MSREQAEVLPADLQAWLDERAEESDADSDDLLVRAVAAYRLVEEEGETLSSVEDARGTLEAEIASLEARLAAVEEEFDENIDDVRDRVIQVKRESDAKAPLDHGHSALEDQVEAAEATAADARERISRLDERSDRGFENYEEILTSLRDTTDDLGDRVTRLAHAFVDLRGRTVRLEGTVAERTAAADLKRDANRKNVTSANCAACRSTVHIGLLSDPRCPHCEQTFTDVQSARRFFGSAVLSVGDRPALEGERAAEVRPADLLREDDEGSNSQREGDETTTDSQSESDDG